MPPPTNCAELRTYLGMVNYVSKFCPNLADALPPLRNLLKKEVSWSWTTAQQKAFEKIQEQVSSTPVLALYDPNEELFVETDASDYGLGAALMQRNRPIADASRLLSDAERRYHPIEKEMLAIVFGLERFHHYVFGRHVQVVTDHKPLVGVCSKSLNKASRRLLALLLRCEKYSFSVTYRFHWKETTVAKKITGRSFITAEGLRRNRRWIRRVKHPQSTPHSGETGPETLVPSTRALPPQRPFSEQQALSPPPPPWTWNTTLIIRI